MSLLLRVLTGARAGHEQVLDKSLNVAGRHPMCDLRFDAERDRDVSTRHAEIRSEGEAWMVRDLGSTNGTFLNGERLVAERVLSVRDTLSFGEFGPRVEVAALTPHLGMPVVLEQGSSAGAQQMPAQGAVGQVAGMRGAGRPGGAGMVPPLVVPPRPPEGDGAASSRHKMRKTQPSGERMANRSNASGPISNATGRPVRSRLTTGERVAQAVRENTQGLRRLVVAAFGLLLVVVGVSFWMARRGDAARRAEIATLLQRNDSLSSAFEREMTRVSGTVAGLDSALATARVEGDSLRARLSRARSTEEIAAVTAQLERVQSQRARLVSVGQLDNTAIAAANGPAVAFLAVRMPDSTMFTGTAFALTPQGLLVTNRHLVRDPGTGDVARELLVKFNGSRQWLPARIVSVIETDDLALLQVDARGTVPAVRGIANGGAPVGAPTLLMGFPLGMDTPQDGQDINSFTAAATLGTATVSKVLPDVLQLDAYAGEGSSGSPVFDREGRVAGVVYGGARASGGRIVYAVPASRLLRALPASARR